MSKFDQPKKWILMYLDYRGLAYEGGKTTFDLVEDTGYKYRTVQMSLRELEKEGKIYRIAVRSHSRKDGRTCPMWYLMDGITLH